MKMFFKAFAAAMTFVTALVLSSINAFAATDSNIDWDGGFITATGMGFSADFARNAEEARATARVAAESDALSKLAGAINGVQVDSETTVENMRLKNSIVRTKVQAVIRGAQVIESTVKYVGTTCYLTMQVPMFGVSSLAGAVLERPAVKEPIPDPVPQVTPSSVTVSVDVQVAQPVVDKPVVINSAKGNYTGVIIDCTGLGGLNPVMSPVIKNANGQKIYGHKNLNPDLVIEKGMASYSKGMSNVDRAGSNPLIIKAVRLEDHNANPVLSLSDANLLLVENSKSGFLDELKVVFVR